MFWAFQSWWHLYQWDCLSYFPPIFTFVLKSSSQTVFIFWKKMSSCSSIYMLTIRIPIWVLYAEFSWYWPYGFREGVKNVKKCSEGWKNRLMETGQGLIKKISLESSSQVGWKGAWQLWNQRYLNVLISLLANKDGKQDKRHPCVHCNYLKMFINELSFFFL